MKRVLFLAVIAAHILTSSCAAIGADTGALLDRMIALAVSHDPNIKAAAERVAGARALVREASSASSPRVGAAIGAFWNKDPLITRAIDPLSGMPIGVVPLSQKNVYAAGIGFIYTLWSGGSIEANERAASLALSSSLAHAERTYQSVLAAVRSAFWSSLRAAAHLRVAEDALELTRTHLAQAEALLRAGVVPMGDVLRVKVAVSKAELDRITAENALDTTLVAIERLTGEMFSRTEIRSTIDSDTLNSIEPPSFDAPSDAVGLALSRRAELSAYRAEVARARELARAASGSRSPRVFIAGEALSSGSSFWPSDDDSWHVQLGAAWTIFDGGEAAAKRDRALAASRALTHEAEDMEGRVRQEAVEATLALRSARTRLSVARDQVLTAEEDHRIAQRRYESQVGTNIDVLDARLALTSSRTAYVDAVFDIASAQSEIIFAAGMDEMPDGMF